jgi:serine/threonine protein kinase
MTLPLALTPGTVIGNNYIIGSLINSGGFGAVYRAVDRSEGNRPCAIKETYDVTPAARRQALMEVSVLFTIKNAHLPQVYDALEANGRFYLVMQLIEGRNLLELLKNRVSSRGLANVGEQEPHQVKQGPCSEQEVLSWLYPIMEMLQELHSRNIVHRDIKPANIILTPDGTTVLVDFGLTRLYDAQSNNTQSLVRAVSEGFSPLEQYTSKTGPQADIYAMAATLYLLLTNRLPPSALRRSMHDELIAPRLLNPTLSPHVERALLKALAVQVDDRYRTMTEFAQALHGTGFDAHADKTIVGQQIVPPTSPSYPLHPSPTPKQPVPARVYAGVQQPVKQQAPVYPILPPSPLAPQGYVVVPQSSVVASHPLPTPFGQGCLFGLIQAILAALLVLALKKEASFYLATAMGFLFYALAGFTTTRRGGSSLRGSWAGLWAGVTSAIMFWVILFIGLFVLLAQRVEADTTNAQKYHVPLSRNELNSAWQSIQPIYPHAAASTSSQTSTNLLVLIIGGMLVASLIGWFGGRAGMKRHREQMAKKQQLILNNP